MIDTLTYRELLADLQKLTDEQLDMTVCVLDEDMESFDISELVMADDVDMDDVIGENQPVLLINKE